MSELIDVRAVLAVSKGARAKIGRGGTLRVQRHGPRGHVNRATCEELTTTLARAMAALAKLHPKTRAPVLAFSTSRTRRRRSRAAGTTPVSSSDVPMVRNKLIFAAPAAIWTFVACGAAHALDAGPGNAPAERSEAELPSEEPPVPPAGASSDSAPPTESEDPPADAHMPEPLAAIQPEYPSEAAAARLEATVVLRVSIDAEGNVTEAEVIEPAGHGFDEAARDALLRVRYRPARRGDTNVASRVLVRVEFRLPPALATGSLEGRILLPGRGASGAAGVEITVRAPDGATETTRTGEHGRFRFDSLAPGAYAVTARAPGLGQVELQTEVVSGQGARITARLEPLAAEAAIEVTVRGVSEADRRRQSAEAVTVVETERAKRESADMGEVLARAQGVGVRRGGGLGSSTRFSLNGLTDDQVRFFLDGVPLELAGYPFGVANVPVNLVERIEIYSGVVPIRFGADALGGAVNLVTSHDLRGAHAGASYEVGSFDTHRLTLSARNLHEPSGFFMRVNGFFDYARNDYPVDVEIPDERGRLSPARVYRFHDGYHAAGGNAELGLVDRPWARRLVLRAFVTDYDKDYQHNVVMTVPYGGVTYGEFATGASLRYQQPLGRGVTVDVIGGYTYIRGDFLDVATCVYDWFGRCVRERRTPGETDSRPHDQLYWHHSAFGRVNLEWRAHHQRSLRLSIAPTHLTRTGDERRQSDPGARDPLTAERKLTTIVTGLEYELDLFSDRLENILFGKQYVQLLASEEPRPGDIFRRRDRDTHRFGFGDALRFRFTRWLHAKASYEYATRLPRPDEVFGDNAFIIANLELEPETSHNANLGIAVDARETRLGAFRAGVNGFSRDADQLIVLLGNNRVQSYQNVFGARSFGVEAALGWTSPLEYVVLDVNATCLDFRNFSSEGTFGAFDGDRIPNRPYLFANGSARLQFRGVVAPRDEVALTWTSRYVHEYFRGWESIGLREFKQTIDSQLVHTVGLGYFVKSDDATLSSTLEVQNATDEVVFDFFGVQRPGRAFYVKTTAEF
jgi:vitamin B12 transporter